jgi:hypothetical protein
MIFLNRKHTLGVLNFHHSMTRPAPLTPLSSSKIARVAASGGPDSSPPREVIAGGILPAPGSLDIMVSGDWELGMSGFP